MKILSTLACTLLVIAFATAEITESQARKEFQKFKHQFDKSYATREETQHRFQVFRENLIKYEEHNSKNLGWTEGVNKFSDLTKEEFKEFHLNGYVNMYKEYIGARPPTVKERSAAPAAMNWSHAITPVKDQGSCGSCWAFATAESIESYAFLNNGTMKTLSTQQITSCTPNSLGCGGGGGCTGAVPQLGFTYTQFYGIQEEATYPYVSGTTGATGQCLHDPAGSGSVSSTYVRGYEMLPRNNYDAILEHVGNIGPLSVSVDASAWSPYNGGVFDGCPVSENVQINHAVQLVGYGTDPQLGDYWWIRNSWGEGWGENGFMRLKRNSSPLCGNDNTPLFGTGCSNDGVEVQYVCGTCGILFDVTYPIGAYHV